MTSKDFCPLHTHSEYSVLDGIIKLEKLCEHIKDIGMSACALTDHGNLHGLVEFYSNAKAVGIKPLIGVEAYITEDEDGLENTDKHKDNYHCILLAENNTGLRNLVWLTNQAFLHNFYHRPRISVKNLEAGRAEGLIATSSCLGGLVCKQGTFSEDEKIFIDEDKRAERALSRFKELFSNKFYAEIQDHPDLLRQTTYNKWLVQEAKAQKIPLVITTDAHFLTEEDYETHRLVMAQQLKITMAEYAADDDGLYYVRGNCIRTIDDMYNAAISYDAEEAFWNTSAIASKCNVDISLGKYQSPMFDVKQQDDYEEFRAWRAPAYEC